MADRSSEGSQGLCTPSERSATPYESDYVTSKIVGIGAVVKRGVEVDDDEVDVELQLETCIGIGRYWGYFLTNETTSK